MTFSTTFLEVEGGHEEIQIFKPRKGDLDEGFYVFSVFEAEGGHEAQHVQFKASKEEVQELIQMLNLAISQ